MSAPLVLGLDVGTSSVKALVLDGDGEVLECRSAAHALTPTPGAVEADPRGWWEAALAAIAQLDAPLAEIAAIGLSGNMSSVVLLDGDGAPLRPAPLLADTRGGAELDALPADVRAALAERSRNPVNAISSLASLLWLRDHDAGTFARARAWVSAKDWIRLRLTGELLSDSTDAHNALVHDPASGDWDRELIARVGLDPALFPPLRDGGAAGGALTAEAATLTGLSAGIPVAVGGGDMATAAVGAGAAQPGTLALSLGTSVTAIAPLGAAGAAAFADDWRGKLTLHPLPGGRGAFALASLLTGGLALNWLRALGGGTIPELPAGEAVVPDPSDPLIFVPQLSGAGSPDFAPELRGALLGLTPHTGGARIALALFEAIAFELAEIVALVEAGGTPVGRIVATGGGANIDAWVQTLADVLATPVELLVHHDVSAIGAALLAREALGQPLPPALAGRVARRVMPRPQHAGAWQARAARYREARALALAYARLPQPPSSEARPGGATP
ncbi:FGGY family carbohydrate kinase [Conexibacter stalactiti]|uniref:FGGY family carbohydrate kinase n=1 Tax=Conexibacter stalactiti TaxID=1940611 RepID=A0ABU4HSF6_9ACTN|nr:FGGY family carbohydrate kinase [Conexibacter stalactiti]MDW5595612.1 FGGY family carbohydrate kinase [Conexibacter stalactiti]MEC5036254.1 FGGY family carbohydrate kinase [Conexibacter stalactiti]